MVRNTKRIAGGFGGGCERGLNATRAPVAAKAAPTRHRRNGSIYVVVLADVYEQDGVTLDDKLDRDPVTDVD